MLVKWVPLYCTLDVEWVTFIDVLNLNLMIYHYIRQKTNDSERKRPINLYNQVYFMICIFDIIAVKFIYFTFNLQKFDILFSENIVIIIITYIFTI